VFPKEFPIALNVAQRTSNYITTAAVAFVLELSKISGVFSAFCFPFPKSWPRLTGDSSKQPASKRTHPRSLEVCCATILTITRRVQNVLFFPLDLVLESRVDREFE
jgi:hypothetical protein